MGKMRSILSHIGAWSPKAEQMASAAFLGLDSTVDSYMNDFKSKIESRLRGFYQGFQDLKNEGHPVDAIPPEAAIYLTVQVDLRGKKTANGTELMNMADVTSYMLKVAGVALVPFSAFGASQESNWYRLSVGTTKPQDVNSVIQKLRTAFSKLS
jgi:aspartate aminotransferase